MRFPIADIPVVGHHQRMAWLAELIIQGFWECAVETAYRKGGWIGGGIVLFGPFILAGLILWLLFG